MTLRFTRSKGGARRQCDDCIMESGAIDWNRVEENLAALPRLRRVVRRDAGRWRLGTCSVLVEWLHAGRPGTLIRAEAVEADLELVESAGLPSFAGLLTRLATGSREDVFATLAELFAAAWYLRSGRQVLDVHADNGEADVVIADGDVTAHVEVRDLSAPASHYLWGERWGELQGRLQDLKLPYLLEFHGVSDLRYELLPGGDFPTPVRAAAPDLSDIDWIVKQVLKAGGRPRPWKLAAGFSQKYTDLWIEASDRYGSGVMASWGSSGWAFPAGRMVDRILKKDHPTAPGRRVLLVEISRYPGETLIEDWSREQARQLIADKVKSWDAIVAFGRWWDRPDVAQVYVMHLAPGAEELLPKWGPASAEFAVPAATGRE